jgi:uncharacterized membrane protein YqiK
MDFVMAYPSLLIGGGILVLVLAALYCVVRYVPNTKMATVEKLFGTKSLSEGDIVALKGEAGFQPEVKRGGFHLFYWRWQYKFHKRNLITIKQGKIGYVFARAGIALAPTQTLGSVVECNNFQNARHFLSGGGQKGRQRAILREGVYAVNLAVFNVITEDSVYSLEHDNDLNSWREQLVNCQGFDPVVIGQNADDIGIVTTQDGPALDQGEIIAPAVGTKKEDPNYHSNFQDVEAFLEAGGRRGLQYAVLLDGTYFINRWFANVELKPKFVVPIGNVGVVVSYYGKQGTDTSGTKFRHGERVHEGERGVWETTLGPGKYPFNPYAGNIVLVPTTNFVLHWITGKSEGHKYDESLKSVDLITKDAYEPILPLSVVVHCDYQKAPNLIQRFGDVKQLITQTIDPLLSAFFRDVAHKKTMLELVHSRDEIQKQARLELREKFAEFDIECIDVLIGRPESAKGDDKIENLLEQLRQRQLSLEQIETFGKQEAAAEKQKTLNDAQSRALLQKELTASAIKIQVATNEAEADLARAKKVAEMTIVTAEADARKLTVEGKGKGDAILSVGGSEAEVLQKKIASFGNSNLYAMSVIAESLSNSKQPLVPATSLGGSGDNRGVLNLLMSLMVKDRLEDKPVVAPSEKKAKS